MTKPKPKHRRVALTAGQAMRLQRAHDVHEVSMQSLRSAETEVERQMAEILAASNVNGDARWVLEADGDRVELVEVLPDE